MSYVLKHHVQWLNNNNNNNRYKLPTDALLYGNL